MLLSPIFIALENIVKNCDALIQNWVTKGNCKNLDATKSTCSYV